jgi:rod shape-determining protein MreC
MASSSPTLGRRRTHLALFLLLAAHVLLISVQLTTAEGHSVFQTVLLAVFSPVQRAAAASLDSIRNLWTGYVDLRQVREENRELKEKVARLEQALWMERDRVASYDRMSRVMQLASQLPFESQVGQVVGLDASAWFQSLTVNRGSDQSVELNAPVIGSGGLVGRVVALGPQVARVQLVSDRTSSVGALLVRSRARGIVSGEGHAALQLKYVSNLEDVKVGDLVVTSGVDGIYPKGLAVGRVEQVRNGPGLFKIISLSPAANIERLEEVFILPAVGRSLQFTEKVE